ncbi:MAG: trigger factor [Verrucomicrobiota bacterium]
MKLQAEPINETRQAVTVTIIQDEITAKENALVGEFAKQAKIPGFRPGKAPRDMIKKRFAKELEAEVRQKLIGEAYQYAMEESKLSVLTLIDVDNQEFPLDAEASLKFTFDIKPEFVVPEYKGLAIEVPKNEVTDEEYAKTREHILNQRADYQVAEKAAEKGDYVKVSYTGKIGEELIADLVAEQPIFGTQSNTWEEAGAEDGPGVKSIVEGLVGMKAGDTKDVEETFPEEHPIEALRGKTATYALEVHEVREKILPKIDEEFLKGYEVETEAEFEAKIRDDIQAQKDQHIAGQKRQQISEKLAAAVDFPVPESLLEQETQVLLRDFMQQHMQRGVTEEQFEERKDELFAGAQEAAVGRVKVQLILSEVAKAEEIQVDNDDINRAIMSEAMATRQKPDDIVKELQKDRARVAELQRQIMLNKALDFVVNEATVTEIEPEPAPAS